MLNKSSLNKKSCDNKNIFTSIYEVNQFLNNISCVLKSIKFAKTSKHFINKFNRHS